MENHRKIYLVNRLYLTTRAVGAVAAVRETSCYIVVLCCPGASNDRPFPPSGSFSVFIRFVPPFWPSFWLMAVSLFRPLLGSPLSSTKEETKK